MSLGISSYSPSKIKTIYKSNISNGTFSIFELPASSSYENAWFDYGIRSGSNQRAGTIMGCFSNGNINYTEYCTTDLGNTSNVTMSLDLSGSYIRLISTINSSDNWNIKAFGRYL